MRSHRLYIHNTYTLNHTHSLTLSHTRKHDTGRCATASAFRSHRMCMYVCMYTCTHTRAHTHTHTHRAPPAAHIPSPCALAHARPARCLERARARARSLAVFIDLGDVLNARGHPLSLSRSLPPSLLYIDLGDVLNARARAHTHTHYMLYIDLVNVLNALARALSLSMYVIYRHERCLERSVFRRTSRRTRWRQQWRRRRGEERGAGSRGRWTHEQARAHAHLAGKLPGNPKWQRCAGPRKGYLGAELGFSCRRRRSVR